jgi:hypothetical protein
MDNVGAFLTSNGRSFHNCGAEIEKALSPYEVVRDLGTLRLPVNVDRSSRGIRSSCGASKLSK